MMNGRKGTVVALLGTMSVLASSLLAQAPGKADIESLVTKAAALVEGQGEQAFEEFKKRDSEWFHDDVYVFVNDMQGRNVFHPIQPELQGKNLLESDAPHERELMRRMIGLLEKQDAGWVEYEWPRPGETKLSKKIAYVKKVKAGERTLIVGSGVYADGATAP